MGAARTSQPAAVSEWSAEDAKGFSKADRIYASLRQAIVSGELAPGGFIDKLELCRRFDVSRLPVTTAINRLAFERLVVVEPQRGSFVAPVDVEDVRQWAFARRALEVEIAAACAREVDARETAARLRQNLLYQQAAIRNKDYAVFLGLDIAFHRLLVEASGLERVGELLDSIRAHFDRVRRMLLPEPGRMEGTLAEHRAIAEAIGSGDPSAAGTAMERHLESTLLRLSEFEKHHPQAFTVRARRADRIA